MGSCGDKAVEVNMDGKDDGSGHDEKNCVEDKNEASGGPGRTRCISENGENDHLKRQKCSPSPALIFPEIAASPPRFVSLEQIMQAAKGVSNMALAHEIAVDREFKIEKVELPDASIHKQVKDMMHKVFWEILQSQLGEDPPNYTQAMILLEDVKHGLQSLFLSENKLKQQINEVLDIELIRQQAEKGLLDFQYYAQYIISVMSRMCAPVRDEEIRDLMKITEVVPLFRGILVTIDLMKLDMANFTIQQIRPHIQQHSVEYEKRKFNEFLETQRDGLEFTRLWLQESLYKLKAASSSENETLPNSAKILTNAYIQLLQWDHKLVFPETLVLDHSRFMDLRDRLEHIALVAATLLVTFSVAGPSVSTIDDFKQKLKNQTDILLEGCEKRSVLAETMKSVAVQIGREVNECLKAHGFPEMEPNRSSMLTGQIEEISNSDHRIRTLIKTRVMEFVELVMTSNTASQVKIPPGLSIMQLELSRLTGQFIRVVTHNRAVFADHYSQILSNLKCEQGNGHVASS